MPFAYPFAIAEAFDHLGGKDLSRASDEVDFYEEVPVKIWKISCNISFNRMKLRSQTSDYGQMEKQR